MRVTKDSAEARLSAVASPQLPGNLQNNAAEAPGVGIGSVDVTSNNETAALCLEIRVVQNLIERCLQLYMNKDEVAKTLLQQARIEPRLTSLVWNKLEEDNAEFFKTYYAKLILIKQITVFNELIDHHHNLLNGTPLTEAPLAPIQKSIQYMPVDNLHKGYTLPQQLPLPPMGHPQIDSTVSSYHLVNANLASGNFHPTQMNYGRWMAMDNKTTNISPALPFVKTEISSPASVASNDQYPFIPREIPEIVDASSFDFSELSHVRSTGQLQLRPGNAIFNNLTNVEEYSGSTVFLDASETNNNVEEFFVDNAPATGSQSEEES